MQVFLVFIVQFCFFHLISGTVLIGYYIGGSSESSGKKFQIWDIPATKITHLIYGFAKIKANGVVSLKNLYTGELAANSTFHNCSSSFDLIDLWHLKRRYPHLRTGLAVGGFGKEDARIFTEMVSNDTTIRAFARNSVDLVVRFGFDGLDLNWLYPETRLQARRYLKLLNATKAALDNINDGKPYFLSIAAPWDYQHISRLPLEPISNLVSWFNVHAFGMGLGLPVVYHHAPLFPSTKHLTGYSYSVNTTVHQYHELGIEYKQLVLGLALYGYELSNVYENHTIGGEYGNRLRKNNSSVIGNGSGNELQNESYQPSGQFKIISYKSISSMQNSVKNSHIWDLRYDESAESPWYYNRVTQKLITFIDAEDSLSARIDYIRSMKLGGVFYLDISFDSPVPGRSLLGRTIDKLMMISTNSKKIPKKSPSFLGIKYPVCANAKTTSACIANTTSTTSENRCVYSSTDFPAVTDDLSWTFASSSNCSYQPSSLIIICLIVIFSVETAS